MSVVRIGATKRFSDNWENIFGGKSSAKKPAAKSAKGKAAKKSPKKSAKTPAKSAGKKGAGAKKRKGK